MWDLVVFALIGLLAGAAARLLYRGRGPARVLATMLLGLAGAVLGGLLSWAWAPPAEGQIALSALLTAFLGAALLLVLWPAVAYVRRSRAAENLIP